MIPRCFVSPAEWQCDAVTLNRDDSHHLTDVLRVEVGSPLVICDGQGGEAAAVFAERRSGLVTVRIVDRKRQTGAGLSITLIQAVPKAQKMDWIIQKATEIGVCAIQPVMTDRGVVKLEDDRADHRTLRWQRIAVEAAKQCRTAWIPQVQGVEPLASVLGRKLSVECLLIGSLERDAVPLKVCMNELRTRCLGSVGLLIGPEGDFSPREFELAKQAGAISVSYGARVLRVETAAIYGLCVLAYELMDNHV
ncbi:MAG: RsmE family RNA methyltransferase [bacterium]